MIAITSLRAAGRQLLILAGIWFSLQPAAHAQVLQLPTPAEQVRPQERALPPGPALPAAPPPGVVVRPLGGAEAPPGAEAVTVMFNAIAVEDATVYPAERLAALYADQLGKEQPLTELFAIARRIETLYRSDGYVLTRVIVPEQTVSDGRFRLTVIEGYVSEITVQGEVGELQPRIEAMLAKIAKARPANLRDIDRYLLLVNDLAGVSARGTLRPGNVPGSSQLVVDVSIRDWDGFGTFNNRGSRFSGPWSATFVGGVNSQSDMAERNEVVIYHTLDMNEQAFLQYSFSRAVGDEGTKIKLSAGYSPGRPKGGLEILKVESTTRSFNAHVSHPVLRSRRANLLLDFGFDFEESYTDALNTRLVTDKLRVLRGVGTFDYRDGYRGVSALSFGVHRGLDIFGASEQFAEFAQSRAQGGAQFWKLTAEVSRLQGIYANEDLAFNLFVSIGGQYAFRPLLAAEEFRLGGERFGRGYAPAELSGDHGVGTAIELQLNSGTDLGIFNRYQVYLFYDFGVVWQLDEAAPPSRPTLASRGFGIRTQVTDWFSLDGEIAKPITRDPSSHRDGQRPRVAYVRGTVRF
jgi:hemolysin activation/secretion protein